MIYKAQSATIKAADAGKGQFVFATFNVIDRDGDVTLPGAFGTQVAKLVGAHDWKAPSIGVVKISERGEEAVADFEVNMEMPSAVEWFKSMKFNFDHGVRQEASYGFDVRDSSFGQHNGQHVRFLKQMDVFEVSPVMIGAGIGTRLTDIKSGGLTMDQEADQARAVVHHYFGRIKELAALRDQQGRKALSDSARERILALTKDLKSMHDDAVTMLHGTPEESGLALKLLELEMIHNRARL
jgi:hypothetical protein